MLYNWGQAHRIDTILDSCIDELDHLPPDSLLRRYPETAPKLAPLLYMAAALRELGSVRLSAAANERNRQRLRQAVLRRQRRRGGLLAPGFTRAVAWAAMLLLVVGLGFGSVTAAAASALPNDRLYGWKRASENLWLAVQPTPERAAAVALALADRRASETAELYRETGQVEAEIVAQLGQAYVRALTYIAAAPEAQSQQLLQRLHATSAEHRHELSALAEQASGVERQELLSAVAASEWAQSATPEMVAAPSSGERTMPPAPTPTATSTAQPGAVPARPPSSQPATVPAAEPTGVNAAQPGRPNQPGNPNQPEAGEPNAVEPANPNQPGPGRPDELPGKPTQPGNPNPHQPGNPAQPSNPNPPQPSLPAQPQPGNPPQPSLPAQPRPGNPPQPSLPAQPRPGNPPQPSLPAQPQPSRPAGQPPIRDAPPPPEIPTVAPPVPVATPIVIDPAPEVRPTDGSGNNGNPPQNPGNGNNPSPPAAPGNNASPPPPPDNGNNGNGNGNGPIEGPMPTPPIQVEPPASNNNGQGNGNGQGKKP